MKITFNKNLQFLNIIEKVSKEKQNVYGILLAYDQESQEVLNLYLNSKNYELARQYKLNDIVNCTLRVTYGTEKYDKVEFLNFN